MGRLCVRVVVTLLQVGAVVPRIDAGKGGLVASPFPILHLGRLSDDFRPKSLQYPCLELFHDTA